MLHLLINIKKIFIFVKNCFESSGSLNQFQMIFIFHAIISDPFFHISYF